MNVNFGKKIALTIAALVLPALAFCQHIHVMVDGDRVEFDGVGPQSVDGRVLVPLRGVLEKMGAFVDYDEATQTVSANRNGLHLSLVLGLRHATVNGHRVHMDVPAQEFHGSTMVPLRFVGEALGVDVKWDPVTYTVNITTTTEARHHDGG